MRTHSSKFSVFVIVLVSFVISVGFSGCEKEEDMPPPNPIVKRVGPKPEADPSLKGEEDENKPSDPAALTYDPEGKRDPFTQFSSRPEETASENQLPLLPLQRYDLGELKMVGVIWGGKDPKALVEDAAGTGYTVSIGERIGRSSGVVTRITEDEIVVREEFPGVGGRRVTRESTLQLTSAGGN